MNIHINNRSIIILHILFGHELSLDTYFFGHELPLDIYYLDIDHCWTHIIMLNVNHKPQLDMDYQIHSIVGYWTLN